MHRIYTPAELVRRNALLLILSVAITFSILRILLYQSPDSDFNVGRYNVHHLFAGLLLITAGGVPLVVLDSPSAAPATPFSVLERAGEIE
jgi:short subunit fatty acids transporter